MWESQSLYNVCSLTDCNAQLIHWLSSSCYARGVHGSVVSGNITDVFGKVGLQVGSEIDGFCSIVTTTSCKESWQPPLPVTNDLGGILPPDCLSKVNIHEYVVEKTFVKVDHC